MQLAIKLHMMIVQIVNLYIVCTNSHGNTTTLAIRSKDQLTLSSAINIIIKLCHTQNAAQITPQGQHFTVHIFLFNVQIQISSKQTIVAFIIHVRLFKTDIKLVSFTSVTLQTTANFSKLFAVN